MPGGLRFHRSFSMLANVSAICAGPLIIMSNVPRLIAVTRGIDLSVVATDICKLTPLRASPAKILKANHLALAHDASYCGWGFSGGGG